MKKTLIMISVCVFVAALAVVMGLVINSDKSGETITTTTAPVAPAPQTTQEHQYMTEPQYTVGSVQTSQKFETDEDGYELWYYDENGFAAKCEVYRGSKMRYYYEATGIDESGNCIQQRYYSPSGKLFGIYDKDRFFDADSNEISEDEWVKLFDKY